MLHFYGDVIRRKCSIIGVDINGATTIFIKTGKTIVPVVGEC